MKLPIRNVFILALFATSLSGEELKIISRGGGPSGEIKIRVSFDGVKKQCQWDTGSNESALTRDAQFRKYRVLRTGKSYGASGRAMVHDIINIKKIQIDKHISENQEVSLYSKGVRRHDCAIGINVFRNTSFLFDPHEKQIRIGGKPPEKNKKLFPMIQNKYNYITFHTMIGTRKVGTIWDSGAGLSVVDRVYLSKNKRNFKFIQKLSTAYDATGKRIDVSLYKAKELRIGDVRFKNVLIISMDFSLIHQEIDKNLHFIAGYNLAIKKIWWFDMKHRKYYLK